MKGICKLPQLENYELSLMLKMKLPVGCFTLGVMILWCQRVSFDTLLTPLVQIILVDTVEPTESFPDTSGSLWVRIVCLLTPKICFLTPQVFKSFAPNGSLWKYVPRLGTYGTQRI